MKIKYVHFLEPEVEKVYDTVVALKNNPFIHMSQAEFDEMELAHLEQDKQKGLILFYRRMAEFPTISNGLIIHCKTETEAKMLMYVAERQGFIWSAWFVGNACGEPAIDNTFYHMYENKTCYRFEITGNGNKFVSCSEKNYYKGKALPVVDFDKFFFGVSYKEMEEYGYDWDGMYGMSAEKAAELYEELDKTFYKLYGHDNSEAEIDGKEDFKSFDGLFGVEKDGFKHYVDTLYKALYKEEMEEEREV